MILLRVSLIFLVLFLLPDWYIYKTYLTSLHHRRWKRAYWLPTVLLLLILVIFLIGHDTLHEYFGTYLIVALCVTIPKTVFMLTSILLKLFRRLVKRPVPHGWIALAPALLTFGYVLFGAIKGKENFQVNFRTHSTDTASCNCRTFIPEAGKGTERHFRKPSTSVTDKMPIWLYSPATS